MNLADLPEDVLSEIFRRLDTKSKLHAWNVCESFRLALRRRSVMRRIVLSGPSNMLDQPNIADLAPHVEEIVFSNIKIDPRHVLPFQNVRALDVSRADVSMYEAATLCKSLPRLKSLGAHFDCPDKQPPTHKIALIDYCKNAFSPLEHVCFHDNFFGIMECRYPIQVLQSSSALRSLHFNIIHERDRLHDHGEIEQNRIALPSLKFFTATMHGFLLALELLIQPILMNFDLNNWIWVLVGATTYNYPSYSMSEKLKVYSEAENKPDWSFEGTVNLHLWHLDLERHNPNLLSDIEAKICSVTPQRICRQVKQSPEQQYNNAYLVELCALPSVDEACSVFERSHVSENPLSFNLDSLVPSARDIRVMLINKRCQCEQETKPNNNSRLIMFDIQSETLRNISYLCLDAPLDTSFYALFEYCNNLQTLVLLNRNTEFMDRSGFKNVIKHIYLSTSIKNLMCVDESVDLPGVLCALSRCPSLVSVLLSSYNTIFTVNQHVTPDVYYTFFKGCPNLLSFTALGFHIKVLDEQLNISNSVLRKLQRNVSITIEEDGRTFNDSTDPYCDAFHFNDIKKYTFEDLKFKLDRK